MEQGWTHAQIERLLYKDSGLLGVSGVSADMRTLRAEGSADAQRAIALFTHRVVRESGSMVACLQGLDVLAFSGGIVPRSAGSACGSTQQRMRRRPARNRRRSMRPAASSKSGWCRLTRDGLPRARRPPC